MKPYLSPGSGITEVDYDGTWFRARYKSGDVYEYSSPPLEIHQIEEMKQLANLHDGLTGYISKNRKIYDSGRLLPGV
jgi:hypothetical protein